MHIFNLHCQVVLRISSITKIYNITRINTSQCKIRIVADEGWFGQPKYGTPSKNHSDHVYLRHLSTEYRSILWADITTNTRSICRPRHGRVSVDMLFELIDCRSTLSVDMSAGTRPICWH